MAGLIHRFQTPQYTACLVLLVCRLSPVRLLTLLISYIFSHTFSFSLSFYSCLSAFSRLVSIFFTFCSAFRTREPFHWAPCGHHPVVAHSSDATRVDTLTIPQRRLPDHSWIYLGWFLRSLSVVSHPQFNLRVLAGVDAHAFLPFRYKAPPLLFLSSSLFSVLNPRLTLSFTRFTL